MEENVTISHPGIEGTAQVAVSSLSVWEDRGWSVVGEADTRSDQDVVEELVEEDEPSFDYDDVADD